MVVAGTSIGYEEVVPVDGLVETTFVTIDAYKFINSNTIFSLTPI